MESVQEAIKDGQGSDIQLSSTRLAATLFLLSTATVLFTLAIFKLLSFFIMPSLFFDLLFVGFPLGAFLGVRFFKVNLEAFSKTLWAVQIVMFLSVAAALSCKHFDYLRAHLFEVDLYKLLIQMGTFTGLFVPFFCAYGLSEYLGYQVGRERLRGRMPLVYGLYLFGAAFAYIFIQFTLPVLGVARIICISIFLVTLASILIAKRGPGRKFLVIETAVLLCAAVIPYNPIEEGFLRLYKGDSPQSTAAYTEKGFDFAFQEWGDYSLTEIMQNKSHQEGDAGPKFTGFYNDLMQWEFSPQYGFTERSLGMLPINYAPRGGSIAIIGSGGGRQVRWARQPRFGFKEIVALELEPAVLKAVRSEQLKEKFSSVYEGEGVNPIRHEARGFMENSDRKFDLIYLPSVGGYPQMMLEPGNMIRTVDAYVTLRDRLSEKGLLAIWYPTGLDPEGILTDQYVQTLRSDRVNLVVKAYFNSQEFLILAGRNSDAPFLDLDEVDKFLLAADDGIRLPPNPSARCGPYTVIDEEGFSAISDDQPFLAGNVSHIFSLAQVSKLFAITAGLLCCIGVILVLALRKRGDPKIEGRSYLQVILISFLIGANFLILEHYLILALFKKLYVFHDALVLGAISFLILSGLGSIFSSIRLLPIFQLIGSIFCVLLLFLQPELSPTTTILLLAPVAFVTGSYFPVLFEQAAHNPLAVFAMDAVGAGLGSMTAFFLPIAFGFDTFFPVAAGVFVLTSICTYLFFRQSGRSETGGAAPSEEPGNGPDPDGGKEAQA